MGVDVAFEETSLIFSLGINIQFVMGNWEIPLSLKRPTTFRDLFSYSICMHYSERLIIMSLSVTRYSFIDLYLGMSRATIREHFASLLISCISLSLSLLH